MSELSFHQGSGGGQKEDVTTLSDKFATLRGLPGKGNKVPPHPKVSNIYFTLEEIRT